MVATEKKLTQRLKIQKKESHELIDEEKDNFSIDCIQEEKELEDQETKF